MTSTTEATAAKLLVVDDSITVRMSLRDVFVAQGYQVFAAESGEEALKLLRSESVDVMVLDLVMPGKSGVDVLREVKADKTLAYIPILLLTAVADRQELVACLEIGADDFIVKPWDKRELLGRLRSMVRLNRALKEAVSAQRATEAANAKLERGNQQLQAEIAERKRMEQELVQAQKLESIGRLAAGIAHEINTPSQYIGDNVCFLQEAFRDIDQLLGTFNRLLEAAKGQTLTVDLIAQVEAAVREADIGYLTNETPRAIQQSLEGVDKVAEIIRAMKEFSHPGSDQKQAVDLNRAIESTLIVSGNEWKHVADLVTDFDLKLSSVPCFPSEFNQVILNLIVNAAQTISDVVGDGSRGKGTITVSTRRDNDCVEIRIQDTGTGIPEEIRSKVFDHFFTTKEVGKGTGQGLTIARSIVTQKHGGTIRFETEPGKGTVFIVRLPIADSLVSRQDVRSEEVQAAC